MPLLRQRECYFICSTKPSKTTEAVEKCDYFNIHLQPVLKGGFGQVGTCYMLLNGTERYHIPVGSATITCWTLDLFNGFSLKMYKTGKANKSCCGVAQPAESL